jgi:hypothetical protein
MNTNARQIMRILDYRGIDIRLEQGRLIGKSRIGPMLGDMVRFITHFRPVIIAELEERERLAETVDTILQLTTEELVKFRQEIATAPADDPWIDHDRRALRIADERMAESETAA